MNFTMLYALDQNAYSACKSCIQNTSFATKIYYQTIDDSFTLQHQLQIAKIKVRYIQGFFMCCMVTWLFQNLFLTIILSGWILMKFSCNGDKQDRIVTCQNYGGEKCVLESKGIYFAGVPRRCGNFGRLSQSL